MIVCTLTDVLQKRGMSRCELSRRAGVHVNTVCKMANNESTLVHMGVLEVLCEVLGVQPGDLLRDLPWREAQRYCAAQEDRR